MGAAVVHATVGTSKLTQPHAWERWQGEPQDLAEALRALDGMNGGWWCGGSFRSGGKRSKAAWGGNGGLAPLDYDMDGKAALPGDVAQTLLDGVTYGALPWACYAHTTPHGFRLVAVLSEPIKSADAYAAVVDALAAYAAPLFAGTGLHLDPGSREPWRAMYAPGARVDGVLREPREVSREAEPFDVAAALAARKAPRSDPEPGGGVVVGRKTGGAVESVSAARAAWVADHLPEPITRAECPLCGHKDCWQVDAEGRWYCYSTSHAADAPAGVGGVRESGEGWGDVFDLALHESGLTDRALLERDGYLTKPEPPKTQPDPKTGEDRPALLLPGHHWDGTQDVVRERRVFVEEVVQVIPTGTLYRREQVLVMLDTDARKMVPITPAIMQHLIDKHALTFTWTKTKGGAARAKYVPVSAALASHCVEVIPTLGDASVPPVDMITSVPSLTRNADRSLRQCAEGYDAEARVYTLPHGLHLRDDMTPGECRATLEDLIVDYPFQDEADRQNLIAMMVTLVCRPAMNVAPLFVIGASLAGTGKSKLATDTVGLSILGDDVNTTTYKAAEEEMRKYLDSALLNGDPFAVLDNVPAGVVLDSASLAAALTVSRIDMRILGHTQTMTARNLMTLCITGNNTKLSHELARRSCPITLVPRDAHPERRKDFVHPLARDYATQQRGAVLSSILSGVKRWHDAGMPEPVEMPRTGSFEEWRNVVGGIMEHGLGYDLVMSNSDKFMGESGDGARDDLAALAGVFDATHGMGPGNAQGAEALYDLAMRNGLYTDAMLACRSTDDRARAAFFRARVLSTIKGVPTENGKTFRPVPGSNDRQWFLDAHRVDSQVASS